MSKPTSWKLQHGRRLFLDQCRLFITIVHIPGAEKSGGDLLPPWPQPRQRVTMPLSTTTAQRFRTGALSTPCPWKQTIRESQVVVSDQLDQDGDPG